MVVVTFKIFSWLWLVFYKKLPYLYRFQCTVFEFSVKNSTLPFYLKAHFRRKIIIIDIEQFAFSRADKVNRLT